MPILLKEMRCKVAPEARQAFHAAQCLWKPVTSAEGFLWQLGGWLQGADQGALLLAAWRDAEAHRAFMRAGGLHDRILEANRQENTMLACEVALHEMGAEDVGNFLRLVPATEGVVAWISPRSPAATLSMVLDKAWTLHAADANPPI